MHVEVEKVGQDEQCSHIPYSEEGREGKKNNALTWHAMDKLEVKSVNGHQT